MASSDEESVASKAESSSSDESYTTGKKSHLNHVLTTTACADPRQSARSRFASSVRSDDLINGDGKYIYLDHHNGHLADADFSTDQPSFGPPTPTIPETVANMNNYEEEEIPPFLHQMLHQTASDGFGPSAEVPMSEDNTDNSEDLNPYLAPSVASYQSHQSSQTKHAMSTTVPLTYEEACRELSAYCEDNIRAGCELSEREIDVIAYDEIGGETSHHTILLTLNLDLKDLINKLQGLIDGRERDPNSIHRGKGKYLIRRIDVRCGQRDMDSFLPAIEGVVTDATSHASLNVPNPSAQWVTWNCISGGPMNNYWDLYCTAIQLGVAGNVPVLRLHTVKCRDTYNINDIGHIFDAGGSRHPRVRRWSGGKPPGGGIFEKTTSTSGVSSGLNPIASAFKFGATFDEAVDASDPRPPTTNYKGKGKAVDFQSSNTDGVLHGGEYKGAGENVTVDTTTTEWKKAPIPDWDSLPPAINHNPGGYQAKPTSWTYWQRIGGDPKTHKEFPLGHIPYPVSSDIDHCDFLPGEPIDMKTSIASAMKAIAKNEKPIMPKLSAQEQAILDDIANQTRKEFNNARGFDQEDDDIFIPTANPNWNPNGPKNQLTKDKEAASGLTSMANIPARYQTQAAVSETRQGPPSYVTAYYGRPTQQNAMAGNMAGTSSGTMSGTDASARFASPRATQSKSTFPSGGRARPFTPSQMTSFQAMNAGSRPSTPTLRYGGSTSSFAMPSTSIGFNAPPNTISRSRPSSPANLSQITDQLFNLNMANPQGQSRGHNNQLFVPNSRSYVPEFGANQNTSNAQGLGNLSQNSEWNFTQEETKYPFGYNFEFGGSGGNGGL
ncbi:hypothetical protein BELL_0094g00020 [Botrytis elliptica]|uniref:Uncharacterized protein n=1 Tax=Botrytis elliptica TaxID=278938 RepID=A0A4Z1K1B6_9HELO|nr:hypothetical protein EAE99_003722 [Botrytis elliptica]TGO77700.1 hypothetical protein BELL_0094g00020 [Botrytis elliptica]